MLLTTLITGAQTFALGVSIFDGIGKIRGAITGNTVTNSLADINEKLDKIVDDRLGIIKIREVEHHNGSRARIIDVTEQIERRMLQNQKSLGVNLIQSQAIEAPEALMRVFGENPERLLTHVRKLDGADYHSSLINDPTMVPVIFEKWGVSFVGWIKEGFLSITLNTDYRARVPEIIASSHYKHSSSDANSSKFSMPFNTSPVEKLNNNSNKPKIGIIGIGCAGGNAINNMVNKNITGVDLISINTDLEALNNSRAECRIQIGRRTLSGLGATMRPSMGEAAALESIHEINDVLEKFNLVFIVSGMGGGTGSGASPVIAEAARKINTSVVSIATMPFAFEGQKRYSIAKEYLGRLKEKSDSIVMINNQNLFKIATENTTIMDAFNVADDVLYSAVKSISDLTVNPGIIHMDFSDLLPFISNMGDSKIGFSSGTINDNVRDVVLEALKFDLFENSATQNSSRAILSISCGKLVPIDMINSIHSHLVNIITPNTELIVGTTVGQGRDNQFDISIWLSKN